MLMILLSPASKRIPYSLISPATDDEEESSRTHVVALSVYGLEAENGGSNLSEVAESVIFSILSRAVTSSETIMRNVSVRVLSVLDAMVISASPALFAYTER